MQSKQIPMWLNRSGCSYNIFKSSLGDFDSHQVLKTSDLGDVYFEMSPQNWLEKDEGCGAKKEKQEVETFTTGKTQVER